MGPVALLKLPVRDTESNRAGLIARLVHAGSVS